MADDKRIIIDEDWKSQVAAEKAAAEQEARKTQRAEPVGQSGGPAVTASFDLLATTFVTEAMVALGQMPHPATGQLAFDAVHARFAIDMLEVIAEKTKGNLTPDEERGLNEVLHQLRMAFVAINAQLSSMDAGDASQPDVR